MKRLIVILLVSALPVISMAQVPASNSEPPGVVVVKARWLYQVNWGGKTTADVVQDGAQARSDNQRVRPNNQGQDAQPRRSGDRLDIPLEIARNNRTRDASAVEIRNEGQKTIRAINYDFLFVDPATGKEFFRYNLKNKTRIAPGETKVLKDVVSDDRSERFRPAGDPVLGTRTDYKVIIREVEFSDGSRWRRP